jgi:hypothetical protein
VIRPASAEVGPSITGLRQWAALAVSTGVSVSKGLSSGAKAGIGVGAVLGGLVILMVAVLLLTRRRRRARSGRVEHVEPKRAASRLHHDDPIPYTDDLKGVQPSSHQHRYTAVQEIAAGSDQITADLATPELPGTLPAHPPTATELPVAPAQPTTTEPPDSQPGHLLVAAELPVSHDEHPIRMNNAVLSSGTEDGQPGLEVAHWQHTVPSDPKEVPSSSDVDQQRASLMQHLEEVRQRRERLQTIHAMEEEEARIKRQLEALNNR